MHKDKLKNNQTQTCVRSVSFHSIPFCSTPLPAVHALHTVHILNLVALHTLHTYTEYITYTTTLNTLHTLRAHAHALQKHTYIYLFYIYTQYDMT